MLRTGDVVLGRYRVLAEASLAPPSHDDLTARLFDAALLAEGGQRWFGPRVRLCVLQNAARDGLDPDGVLARATRYALGVPGLALPLSAGVAGTDVVVSYQTKGDRCLADELGGREPLAPRVVAHWISDVAAALGALHDQGIGHGHLRAGLVLLDREKPWLAGFGVGQIADAAYGRAGAAASVPARYRAPEVRAGGAAGPETDLYALGVLAVELLVGAPAPDDGPLAALDRVPPEFVTVVREALHEAPGGRPASVRDWARRLMQLATAGDVVPSTERGSSAAAPPSLPASGHAQTIPAPDPEEFLRQRGLAAAANAEAPPAEGQGGPPAEAGSEDVDTLPAPHTRPFSPAHGAIDPRAETPQDTQPAPPSASAPPSLRPRGRGAVTAAIVGGLLLLVVGVFAVLVFALRARSAPGATNPLPSATPRVAPPASPPRPPAHSPGASPDSGRGPAGSDDGAPSAPRASELSSGDPATYPSDADAPLPLDSGTPVLGGRGALATVALFGDLDCPHTARTFAVLKAIMKARPGDVRLAWYHRPIPERAASGAAALLASAIFRQSGHAAFWGFVDASLSDVSSELTAAGLVKRAAGQAIDAQLVVDGRDARAVESVARDFELAARLRVRATPTVFVNGKRIDGHHPLAVFEKLVELEVSSGRSALATGTARERWYTERSRRNLANVGPVVPTRTCPPVGASPVRGASDAIVTLVEFSDFGCGHCAAVQPTLERLLARYGGDLALVWKHYPLPQQPRSRAAALLSAEARATGGDKSFWRVHDLLFEAKGKLDDGTLSLSADRAGLDGKALVEAVRRKTQEALVASDVALGDRLDVEGAPSFFVNGRRIEGAQPFEAFAKVIEEEVATGRLLVKNGHQRRAVYDAICGVR